MSRLSLIFSKGSLLVSLLSGAVILTLGLVTSCSKSDDPTTTTTTNTSIQGNWRITAVNINPAYVYGGYPITEIVSPLNGLENNCIGSTTLTFSNGTVTNNATSVSACTNAALSKQLVNTFFGSSTSYTETDNQLTVRGPQTVTATKAVNGGTATLVTSLSVNPAGQSTPTSYTMVLAKQ